MRARLRGRPCFVAADGRAALRVHAIGCGFVAADGRAASLARSIVGLLSRMAEVWLRDPI